MNRKRVIRTEALAQLLGVSKGTIWRMTAAGQLPKSFKLSPAQTVWDAQEIEDWLEAKKAARYTAPTTPTLTAPVQRGRNPVAPSTRTDTKRPGRPKKAQVDSVMHDKLNEVFSGALGDNQPPSLMERLGVRT